MVSLRKFLSGFRASIRYKEGLLEQIEALKKSNDGLYYAAETAWQEPPWLKEKGYTDKIKDIEGVVDKYIEENNLLRKELYRVIHGRPPGSPQQFDESLLP